MLSFLSFIISAGVAFGLPEFRVYQQVTDAIETNSYRGKKLFEQGSFRSPVGPESFRVRYLKFGQTKGRNGSLVIAPGRTESSMKYVETAIDFMNQGYEPVFVIDHRGQGFSDRLLKNTQKGHVQNFSDYVHDFTRWMEMVVKRDPQTDLNNLYLVSNSMGGAITTLYIQSMGPKSPFRAAAHFGPMFEIEFKPGMNEKKARAQASLVCLSGLKIKGQTCDGYADPDWTDYDPTKRHIDPAKPDPNNLTHSVARFNLRNYLWDIRWPSIALGGPTVRWVWQATKANQEMRTTAELKKIQTPFLIVTGAGDTRIVVERNEWYCQKLNKLGKVCEFIEIPEAFHEILMESDEYRIPGVSAAFEFFERH